MNQSQLFAFYGQLLTRGADTFGCASCSHPQDRFGAVEGSGGFIQIDNNERELIGTLDSAIRSLESDISTQVAGALGPVVVNSDPANASVVQSLMDPQTGGLTSDTPPSKNLAALGTLENDYEAFVARWDVWLQSGQEDLNDVWSLGEKDARKQFQAEYEAFRTRYKNVSGSNPSQGPLPVPPPEKTPLSSIADAANSVSNIAIAAAVVVAILALKKAA